MIAKVTLLEMYTPMHPQQLPEWRLPLTWPDGPEGLEGGVHSCTTSHHSRTLQSPPSLQRGPWLVLRPIFDILQM